MSLNATTSSNGNLTSESEIPQPQDTSGILIPILIAICVAIVVLLGCATAFIVWRRSHKTIPNNTDI